MSFLTHNEALLFPAFESYQLVQSSDEGGARVVQSLHTLPSPPYTSSTASSSDSHALSFKQIKDLSNLSPLAPSTDASSALYLDANAFLILLRLRRDPLSDACKPSFDILARLDDADQTGGVSLFAVDRRRWLVLGTQTGVLRLLTATEMDAAGAASTSASPTLPKVVGSLKTLHAFVQHASDTDHDVVSHRLLHASFISPSDSSVRVLVQRCLKARQPSTSSHMRPGLGASVPSSGLTAESAKHRIGFEVARVIVRLEGDGSMPARKEWVVRGDEGVIEAVPREGGYTLLAEAPFESLASRVEASSGPSRSVRGVAQPSSSSAGPGPTSNLPLRPPPPYSWTQAGTQITIVVPLPAHLTSSSFRIHFSPRGLSVGLAPGASSNPAAGGTEAGMEGKIEELGESDEAQRAAARRAEKAALERHVMDRTLASIEAGNWQNRAMGGEIVPSESLWTWEVHRRKRDAGRGDEVGLLTLFLEKSAAHRWISLFGPRRGGSKGMERDEMDMPVEMEEDEDEGEVPETRDPSELLSVLEGLEKYTQDVKAQGLGGVEGAPIKRGGAFEGEEEEDLDSGRDVVITGVTAAAVTDGEGVGMAIVKVLAAETLLASQLPGSNISVGKDGEGGSQTQALVLRSDLDGLVYLAPQGSNTKGWTHVGTLPAVAYVLASKREVGRVVVDVEREDGAEGEVKCNIKAVPSITLLAFEGAVGPISSLSPSSSTSTTATATAGNLYAYRMPMPDVDAAASQQQEAARTKHNTARHARSWVLRIGGEGEGGEDGKTQGGDEAQIQGQDQSGGEKEQTGILLGVASLKLETRTGTRAGERILVCLCERKIVLVRGLLGSGSG